jgi:hypothetical protein
MLSMSKWFVGCVREKRREGGGEELSDASNTHRHRLID